MEGAPRPLLPGKENAYTYPPPASPTGGKNGHQHPILTKKDTTLILRLVAQHVFSCYQYLDFPTSLIRIHGIIQESC
jgi:hypothetical protein